MWYENDSQIINAGLIEGKRTNIVFDHEYLQSIVPSKMQIKRDFIVEKRRSFDIERIAFHYYRDMLYTLGTDHYNGTRLDLEYEPQNKFDPNAIVIRMFGCKLGYISRYDTDEVSWIMTCSKRYRAILDCSHVGFERVKIYFLQEFHDTYSLPYQTDIMLKAFCSASKYKKYAYFIRGSIGHTVTFEESYENNLIAICTDMESVIGYIDDTFIAKQYRKTPIAGYIEDVNINDESKSIEIKMRLLMEKSVVNKNYLKSYLSLEKYFGSFYDAGTYCISLENLIKVVPRKSRSLSAYEPLVKYLKEYHAIMLHIDE